MAFNLVNYSQQDPQWSKEILGFGNKNDTIGYEGCALTSVAMLVSGFGFTETPKTLNDKLKVVNGFVGAAIKWASVSSIHPQVANKGLTICTNNDAPLSQIDASIAAGQPVLVQVDSSPAAGIQTHWVVLYAKQGSSDYLMLDPWPLPTETGKSVTLMSRYSQGRSLKNAISAVVFYECTTNGSGGSASTSGSSSQPIPSGTGILLQVSSWVTAGLRLRSAPSTLTDNTVVIEPAGTLLRALDSDVVVNANLGNTNQWLHVRDAQGKEGYVSASYVEKATSVVDSNSGGSTSPSAPDSSSSTPSQPEPTSPPTQPTTPTQPATPSQPTPADDSNARLKVVVSASIGAAGLKVYNRNNIKGKVVSTQAAGTMLACLDTPDVVRANAGVKGAWLYIRYGTAQKGYVQAEFVQLIS